MCRIGEEVKKKKICGLIPFFITLCELCTHVHTDISHAWKEHLRRLVQRRQPAVYTLNEFNGQ